MSNKMPFLARFMRRRQASDFASGEYSEKNDLHMTAIDGEEVPLILSERVLPETKTITEVRRERED